MKKISLFDFCQTLCDFETADPFVDYVKEHVEPTKRMFVISQMLSIFNRIGLNYVFDVVGHFFHYSINKKLLLLELKGLEKETIDKLALDYYKSKIKPHLIPEMMTILKAEKKSGNEIAIVSASYYPFLRYFCVDFDIDYLVTNEFSYNEEDVFEGQIIQSDCIYKNKVSRLKSKLKNKSYTIVPSYGDSKSDTPILSIAKQGFVVSHKYHKSWVEQTSFKEIIWK